MSPSTWICGSAVLTVALMAGFAQARYEFDNSYYNQNMLDQLEDYFKPWRSERDSEDRRWDWPRFRNPICCGDYEEDSLRREDDIREECYSRVFNHSWQSNGYEDGWNPFSCEASRMVKKKLWCVHQCMWRQRGTLDDKYNRQTGKLREYYRRSEGQRWRQDIVDRAVTKCLPSTDPDRFRPERRGDCSRAHLDFSYCVWEELHANCPERQWHSQSTYCNKVRRYLRRRRSRDSADYRMRSRSRSAA